MPFTVGHLNKIYENLAKLDGWKSDFQAYPGNLSSKASTLDMSLMFDDLSDHYTNQGSGNVKPMGTKENKALEEVFNEASAFYDWGKGSDTPHADDLSDIYNNLANVYGRNSASPDYQMSD